MKLKLGLTLGAMCLAAGANAASLDFVAEAAGNERGVADGTTLTFDGLDVTFSSASTGSAESFAYFDDRSGGPAGLGSCKVLTSSDQCTPSDDDNITTGESVTLQLGRTSDIFGLSFTDADHNDLNSSSDVLDIAVNDPTAFMEYSFANAASTTFEDVDLLRFAYADSSTNSANQFYVNSATASPVPLPAAAPLLGAGLAALGGIGARRRRRKTA